MLTIQIFLASSSELEADRKAFESLLYQKSKSWQKERNIFFELQHWEDHLDSLVVTGLQDRYNETIMRSDIFVMLYWTKVGKYTHEEFDVAYKKFVSSGQPLIYTYAKTEPTPQHKEPSVGDFEAKLEGLKHFKINYKNTEALLNHFNGQLDKLYGGTEAVSSNGKQHAKEHIIDLIQKNDLVEALKELKKTFKGESDSLNAMLAEYINPPGNFSISNFTARLKTFVNFYM